MKTNKMKASIQKQIRIVLTIGLFFIAGAVISEPLADINTARLVALLPDEQDLQSFARTSPVGEAGQSESYQNGSWGYQLSPSTAMLDDVEPDVDLSRRYVLRAGNLINPWRGHYANLKRTLFSENGMYRLQLTVWLCDTPQTAQSALEEYHTNSDAVYQPGTLTGTSQIGNASWVSVGYSPDKSLVFLAGKILVLLNCGPSQAARNQGIGASFPDYAVEAVAYQTLLRASQQPELTGVSVQQAGMNVNGHALPKNALLVAGQTYVPAAEFARAMGLTSQWNAKTGALTFSGTGRRTIALTAGSTAATVGGAKAAALSVPVLKQNGQAVMTLTDLLAVTGGRVVGKSGNTVQVKG